jgi:hypothetical protein
MMNYTRLTKIESDKEWVLDCEKCEHKLECSEYGSMDENFQYCLERIGKRLAELEDKIENGTLIELPCEVGDTVYAIIKAENGYALLKDICDGFIIANGEVHIGLQTYNVGVNKYYFTREEAEKKLQELQE